MFSLTPKNDKFFDMFVRYSEINYKAAKMLKDFASDMENAEDKYEEIKKVEHEGDKMLHSIMEELNRSFITTIDREDIVSIGRALDDIDDFIERTSSRFVMFNMTKSTQHALAFCDLILAATKESIELMKEFKLLNKSKMLSKKVVEINRIEDDGDILFKRTIKELFNGKTLDIEIIIWKEIYERLENVLNGCEDLANIIEGVVMKNA
ncbi:DUF47 domain-containing protein [Haloimpatiens sp. FM7315]|uniref:DUF47 domain-containing protein n=1 Tax=Haloimpatiens sp. FM7315 TaxID=3298609 RepID=UPI00370BF909